MSQTSTNNRKALGRYVDLRLGVITADGKPASVNDAHADVSNLYGRAAAEFCIDTCVSTDGEVERRKLKVKDEPTKPKGKGGTRRRNEDRS
jgi:hypothetical protein